MQSIMKIFSLFRAVKYFAYINFGCVDLSGLQVDIWGDEAEIGKKNITRLAFILLEKPATNPESVQIVSFFDVFRGKYLFYFRNFWKSYALQKK